MKVIGCLGSPTKVCLLPDAACPFGIFEGLYLDYMSVGRHLLKAICLG